MLRIEREWDDKWSIIIDRLEAKEDHEAVARDNATDREHFIDLSMTLERIRAEIEEARK